MLRRSLVSCAAAQWNMSCYAFIRRLIALCLFQNNGEGAGGLSQHSWSRWIHIHTLCKCKGFLWDKFVQFCFEILCVCVLSIFFFSYFFCSSSLFLHPPTPGGKGGLGRGEGVKFICHNQFSCVTFAVVYASPAGLHHRTHNSIVLGHNN